MRLFLIIAVTLFGAYSFAAESNSDCRGKYGPYFLNPYIEEILVDMPKDVRDQIAETSDSDLSNFHHSLGRSIRNKWLWGKRSPALVEYFKCQGVKHPDDMSSRIIAALWFELNKNKTPEEKRHIEAKRKSVKEKRAVYSQIMDECESQLSKNRDKFAACIKEFGSPSSIKNGIEPFYAMVVAKDGSVKSVEHFTGGTEKVRPCLENIVRGFKFSAFKTDEEIDLYITEFPRCRTNLLNNL